MSKLARFRKINLGVSAAFEWVGIIGFLLMMLITTVDVIGAKIFLTPLPGALDTVMLAQLIAMSCAIAMALISGRHVAVEFFVPLLPESLQKLAEVFVNLMGLGLFWLMFWHIGDYSNQLMLDNETTPTIRVPLYPFAWCAALACVPVLLVYLYKLIKSVMELFKK